MGVWNFAPLAVALLNALILSTDFVMKLYEALRDVLGTILGITPPPLPKLAALDASFCWKFFDHGPEWDA